MGVILGGGLGSRPRPLTDATNTPLLALCDGQCPDSIERLYRSNVSWAEKALGGPATPSDAARETVAQR